MRKTLTLLSILMALSMLLAACGNAAQDSQAVTGDSAAGAAERHHLRLRRVRPLSHDDRLGG